MLEHLSISFAYNILKDGWIWFRRKGRRLTTQQVVQRRQHWKAEFESRMPDIRREGIDPEIIIRDMKRVDSYPHIIEKKKGISPWFRVGLMALYYKGIQVGLRWGELTFDEEEDQWRYTNYDAGEKGKKAILIGFIPYESIENVDWVGDEYYRCPHIYCYFDVRRKEPYERLVFCEERERWPDQLPYYIEIADYDKTRKLSKALGMRGFG
jgi:hypothetical protein